MPTVFVAGPAKSGSTFLWECLHQSFHPQHVCGRDDAAGWSDTLCQHRRFLLPAVAADVAQPACPRFQKESAFWRWWGRRPSYTWARYGGPRLPLSSWEARRGACKSKRGRPRPDDSRPFPGHRALEVACLQDEACPAAGEGGRVGYASPLPPSCQRACTPCEHHPGWVDNSPSPCSVSPYRCASRVCAEAPYVPKALRRLNFSAHHRRAFSATAFPSHAALEAASISTSRVAAVEGNPGIFQTPPRHARAIEALTTPAGRGALRFVIGLRDPFDLAFSLWAFLSTLGQEGRRVELRMERALAAIERCSRPLFSDPLLLLRASPPELEAYRLCLDARPTSRQLFWVFGGLYGLHLLGWLRRGFSPSQFLFVRMASLPRAAADVPAIQKELATFLGLSPPPADSAQSGVCLSATMITSKQVIVRAHNASVRDVKSAFRASPTARNLSAFFARHEALRTAIFERERVRVY